MKESICVFWFSVCLIVTQTPDGNGCCEHSGISPAPCRVPFLKF